MLGHTLGVRVCVQAGSGASVGVSSRRRVSRRGQGAMSGEKKEELGLLDSFHFKQF